LGIAVDRDAGKMWVGSTDGSWLGGGDPEAGTTPTLTLDTQLKPLFWTCYGYNTSDISVMNFGATAFDDAAPTDYLTVCTDNIPEPTIIDPSDHFYSEVVTHDGTSTGSTCSFNLDTYEWVAIIKNTTGAVEKWYMINSLRGSNKYQILDTASVETTDANVLTVSGTTFTLGSTLGAKDYLVEFHKLGLAADTASNTDGSINTTATSVNLVSGAGCSVYTGTGSAATVGHGFAQAPDMIWTGRTDGANGIHVYHSANTDAPETDYLELFAATATQDNSLLWNDTAPTSTTFAVGSADASNHSGSVIVANYWHGVEGYSYFGKRTGVGNANGSFINMGFVPKSWLTKIISGVNEWQLFDRAIADDAENVMGSCLTVDSTGILYTTNRNTDAVSNGIKNRSASDALDLSSGTFIDCAWGGTPFKYGNGK
jgi:hypothetical protein